MTGRSVAHVFVLKDVLVVDEDPRIPREPVSAVVVHVQFFVIVSVVSARSAPRREGPDVRLRPRIVSVVDGQRWQACPEKIVRVEGVTTLLELTRWIGIPESCKNPDRACMMSFGLVSFE